jgi:hypothetical protein
MRHDRQIQQETLDRIEASIEEIEIWLRDRLRNKQLYERLKSIRVMPSASHVCGWRANVQGEFSDVEADECRGAVIELQRHYSFRA